MFSRLLQSARSIFTDTTQLNQTKESPIDEPLIDETMVTTRQGNTQEPIEEELDDDNSINVYVPTPSQSQRRQKRAKGEDDDNEAPTPVSAKKRKRLPVRAKDVESPEPLKTRPVVEIPVKKASPELEHTKEHSAEEDEELQAVQLDDQDTEAQELLNDSKHRRFESEELDNEIFSTAREAAPRDVVEDIKLPMEVLDSEDEEDSDDDAPEAVGIQEAAKIVHLKERDTARVVNDQLSASRRRRRQKDDGLKRQVESSKKRKFESNLLSTKKAIISTKQAEFALPAIDSGEVENVGATQPTAALDKRQFLTSKMSLPDMLPAEYLEDTEPQDIMALDDLPRKKAKKTKFQHPVEKGPKDRRVGSTTYRVTKPTSSNLAPKSSKNARNVKESWLQGRSGKTGGINRQSFTKGFFK